MTTAPLPTLAAHQSPGTQRRATGIQFLFNGALFASWASEVPRIKASLGLSELELGAALLALMIGTVMILSLIGPLLVRFGIRRVSGVAAVAGALALLAAALADGSMTLGLSLFVYGIAFGAQDVALNNAGVLLECSEERPLMSGLHAMFSLGALTGALLGAALIWSGLAPATHFFILLAVALGLALAAAPRLPPGGRADDADRNPEAGKDRLWTWPLVALGVFAACAAVVEGAVTDWAGVYLKETVQSPEGVEALGYAGFSLAMLVGRLFGDGLSERWGPTRVGRSCAVVATAGILMALSFPFVATALIGFTLTGVGLSILAPLAFSTVGRVAPDNTTSAMAATTAVFYLGFLIGPPLIGGLAEMSSLRTALSILVLASLAAAVLSSVLRGTSSRIQSEFSSG